MVELHVDIDDGRGRRRGGEGEGKAEAEEGDIEMTHTTTSPLYHRYAGASTRLIRGTWWVVLDAEVGGGLEVRQRLL